MVKWYFNEVYKVFSEFGAKALIFGVGFITIAVTPWHNFEPVSVTKLFAISVVAGVATLSLLSTRFVKGDSLFKSHIDKYCFFGCTLVFILLAFRNQFLVERIFGVWGRNLGGLFAISLILIFWSSVELLKSSHLKALIISIKISSSLVAVYFVLQKFNLDPAPWAGTYSAAPSSTLGNPNFVSSYIAIGFSVTLPLIFSNVILLPTRLLIIFLSILEIFVLVESKSFQGIVIASVSIMLILYFKLLNYNSIRSRGNRALLGATPFIILVFVILIFWEKLLKIDQLGTLRARFDYWQSGLNMIMDSPWLGKGFDYYGESYFGFRSESAALRSPGLFADSAHNYYIDFGAFGGLPLLATFLFPVIYTLFKYLKFFFSLGFKEDNYLESDQLVFKFGLLLALSGFFLQSLISPISHALIYLGAVTTGVLISVLKVADKNSRSIESEKMLRRNELKLSLNPVTLIFNLSSKLICFLVFLLIPILGVQPMVADAKFRNAIEQGDGGKLLESALSQPQSFTRMEIASRIFIDNDRPDLALRILRVMVKENPGNIKGWTLLRETSHVVTEQDRAIQKMRELDPFNLQLQQQSQSQP